MGQGALLHHDSKKSSVKGLVISFLNFSPLAAAAGTQTVARIEPQGLILARGALV